MAQFGPNKSQITKGRTANEGPNEIMPLPEEVNPLSSLTAPPTETAFELPKLGRSRVTEWIVDAYAIRGKTILNGLLASCVAVPISIAAASGLTSTIIPKPLIGIVSMSASMLTWDLLYSAQLYVLYDRPLMTDADGKVSRHEAMKQYGRYAKNCLEADFGWFVSYQAIYLANSAILGAEAGAAAGIAHLSSIVYVDLLRPILLKWNRTLKVDQHE